MQNEKEKMLSGKPYKSFGEELLDERQYAKELIFDFNTSINITSPIYIKSLST